MSVRKHQIVAVSILATGCVALLIWGRWMTIDSAEVEAVRHQLEGSWVATSIETGETRKIEGLAAEACRVEFDGKQVSFRQFVSGVDGRGTYLVEPSAGPTRIDLKVDSGWIMGVCEVKGDELTLCINPFALPERLGVPTRPRPRQLRASDDRISYKFRKESTRL